MPEDCLPQRIPPPVFSSAFAFRRLAGVAAAALVLAAALCSEAQAQTTSICDRTPGIQGAILEALTDKFDKTYDDCAGISVADLRALTELDASNRGLTRLSDNFRDFWYLDSLETLNLSRNRLQSLPDRAFRPEAGYRGGLPLSKLITLNLSRNRLEELPEDGPFRDLGELKNLDLSHNRLTDLPSKIFEGLHNLDGKTRAAGRGLYLNDNAARRFFFVIDIVAGDIRTDSRKFGGGGWCNEVWGTGYLVGFKTYLRWGAPFDVTVPWNVISDNSGSVSGSHGLEFDHDNVTIRAGNLYSGADTIYHSNKHIKKFCRRSEASPNVVGVTATLNNNSGGGGHAFPSSRLQERGYVFLRSVDVRYERENGDDTDWQGAWSPPEVQEIRWVGNPADRRNYVYQTGELIELRASFHKSNKTVTRTYEENGVQCNAYEETDIERRNMHVLSGKPYIELDIGGRERRAYYVPPVFHYGDNRIRDSRYMYFAYRVQPDDHDQDELGVTVRRIIRNGAVIDDQMHFEGRQQSELWETDLSLGANTERRLVVPHSRCFTNAGARRKVQRATHLSFRDAEVTIREGERADVRFRVIPAPNGRLTVPYEIRTGGDTPANPAGYAVGPFGGTVEINPGQSEGVIQVSMIEDDQIGHARGSFRIALQETDGYKPMANSEVTIWRREGVCDRTPQVRDELMRLTDRRHCSDVTNDDLLGVYRLDLNDKGIESLRPRDLLGLTNMASLDLRNNELELLPPRLFEGLRRFDDDYGRLLLDGNPGANFLLVVEPIVIPDGDRYFVRGHLGEGMPLFRKLIINPSGNARLHDFHVGAVLSNGIQVRPPDQMRMGRDLNFNRQADWLHIPQGGCGLDRCYTGLRFSMPKEAGETGRSGNTHKLGVFPTQNNRESSDGDKGQTDTPPAPARATRVVFKAPTYPGGYLAGVDVVTAEVTFDTRLLVDSSPFGDWPTLTLNVGGRERAARYRFPKTGDRSSVLTFDYVLQDGDRDEDGITIASGDSLRSNGASVRDIWGVEADPSVGDCAECSPTGGRIQLTNLLAFDEDSVSAGEGGTMVMPFTVYPPAWSDFTVGYATVAGSASTFDATAEDDDYVAGSGRVLVAAGAASGEVRIFITDDDEIEPVREYFRARLLAGDGYFIDTGTLQGSSTVTGVILEGVCDRTPQVRDALVVRSGTADNCAAFTDEALALVFHRPDGVTYGEDFPTQVTLDLRDRGITGFKEKDFSGLSGVEILRLDGNPFTTLPARLFSPLESLSYLSLQDHALTSLPAGVFSAMPRDPDALHLDPPWPLNVRYSVVGSDATGFTYRLAVHEGAPYPLAFNINGVHPSAPAADVSASLAARGAQSDPFTLARAFTWTITDRSSPPADCPDYQRVGGSCFSGFTINVGATLALLASGAMVTPADPSVCDRTPQVRDRILSLVPTGTSCENVSAEQLAGFEEFDLSGRGVTALKAGDFNDFDGLVTLNLSDNRLTTLPSDWADDIKDTLLRLDLSKNQFEFLPPGIFAGLAGLGAGNPHWYNEPYTGPSEGGSLFLHDNPNHFSVHSEIRVKRVVSATELEIVVSFAPGAPIPLRVSLEASGVDPDKTDGHDPGRNFVRTDFEPGETESSPPLTVVRQDGQTVTLTLFTHTQPRKDNAADCDHDDPPPVPPADRWSDYVDNEEGNLSGCYSGFEFRAALVAPFSWDGTTTPVPPRVSTVIFLPAPRYAADGYVAGVERVVANLVFDKPVLLEGGLPTLELDVGRRKRVVPYARGLSHFEGRFSDFGLPDARVHYFAYSFSEGDEDSDGISIDSANALKLGAARLIGPFGQPADLDLGGFLAPHADRKVHQRLLVTLDDAASSVTAREGGFAELGFSVTPAPLDTLEIPYAVGAPGDTADAGDYAASAVATVSITRGAREGVIRIPIKNDLDIEDPREFFTVDLLGSDDVAVLSTTPAQVVIEEGICDRTVQVRRVLLRRLSMDDCAAVTADDLLRFRTGGVEEGQLNLSGAVLRALGITLQPDAGLITRLKEGDFAGLSGVRHLRLTGNRLTGNASGRLTPALFAGLSPALRTMRLYDNRISSIAPGTFAQFTVLEGLWLNDNDLTELPPGLVPDNESLLAVHLGDNPGPAGGKRIEIPFLIRPRFEYAGDRPVASLDDAIPLRVAVPSGAPDRLEYNLAVSGGDLECPDSACGIANIAVVRSGSARSPIFTVTRKGGGRVEVSIQSRNLWRVGTQPGGNCSGQGDWRYPDSRHPEGTQQHRACFTGLGDDFSGVNFVYGDGTEEMSAPVVTGVEFTSAPTISSDGYAAGLDTVSVEVVFSAPVFTDDPAPGLVLDVGGVERRAAPEPRFVRDDVLRFDYKLRAEDVDPDGIAVRRIDVRMSSVHGTFRTADATIPPQFQTDNPGHKVYQRGTLNLAAVSGIPVVEGGVAEVGFQASTVAPPAFTVNYVVGKPGDTAGAGDYDAGSGRVEVTFGAVGVIRIPITDDEEIDLPRETFTLALAPSPGLELIGQTEAEVIILEGVCDRTPGVRDRLMEKLGTTDCAAVTNEDLAGLRGALDLSFLYLTSLRDKDFLGVTGLQELYLNDNRLTRLPTRHLADLSGLTYLVASRNQLRTLAPGSFAGVSNLRAMDIGDNAGNIRTPFRLALRVEEDEDAPSPRAGVRIFRVVVPEGTPREIRFQLVAENGSFVDAETGNLLSSGTPGSRFGNLAAGATQTDVFGAEPENDEAVLSLRVSVAIFLDQECPGSQQVPLYSGECFHGLELFAGEPLTLASEGVELPEITGVSITSTPKSGEIYVGRFAESAREEITVEVAFSAEVSVSGGRPVLELEIGDDTRDAVYDVARVGLATDTLEFTYRPTHEDFDRDGISVASDALTLPSGARLSSGGVDLPLFLGGARGYVIRNAAGHKVRGDAGIAEVTVVSRPANGLIYVATDDPRRREEIAVELGFNTGVVIGGEPFLELEIGDETRRAAYDPVPNPVTRATFLYRPVEGDNDRDGLSIRADALKLPEGASIALLGLDVPAELPRLGGADADYAVRNAAGHQVMTPPVVERVAFNSEPENLEYYIGTSLPEAQENIVVEVFFSTEVEVVGTPELELEVGARTRLAEYSGEILDTSGTGLFFSYSPTGDDVDTDGVSIPRGLLVLGEDAGLAERIHHADVDVNPGLPTARSTDVYVIANESNQKVLPLAELESIEITSRPAAGDTYVGTDDEDEQETIVIEAVFSTEVRVEGRPTLILEIETGNEAEEDDTVDVQRTAVFVTNPDEIIAAKRLVFHYKPLGDDNDLDGISIADNPVARGTATITTASSDGLVQLNISGAGGYVIRNDANHKVRGDVRNFDVRIVSMPRIGGFYAGTDFPGDQESIEVELLFNAAVTVGPGPAFPTLELTVGDTTRTATYDSDLNPAATAQRLFFRYRPVGDDDDPDGVSISAGGLATPGGASIQFEGEDVPLELDEDLSDAAGHGVVPQATAATVTITSSPRGDVPLAGGGTLGADRYLGTDIEADQEEIVVEVVFSTAVSVQSSPTLSLEIGDEPRAAVYDDDRTAQYGGVRDGMRTATTLVFSYKPTSDDDDRDGVSVRTGAIGFPEGADILFWGVRANPELPALPDAGDYAVLNAAEHKVIAQARVVSVEITSDPASGDRYTGTDAEAEQETITAEVTFSTVVTITQGSTSPMLGLEIGYAARSAEYDAASASSDPGDSITAATMTFRYNPLGDDNDRDGISILTGALTREDSLIHSSDGVGANLNLPALDPPDDDYAIRDAAGHKVRGELGVIRVEITSSPRSGFGYGGTDLTAEQQDIAVSLEFNVDPVLAGGDRSDLRLDLEFGDAGREDTTRIATYDAGLTAAGPSYKLFFSYTPTRDDRDDDGISIRTDALKLPAAASLRFESEDLRSTLPGTDGYAILNAGRHKVFPRPRVTALNISSSPDRGGDFYVGTNIEADQEEILFDVGFNLSVDIAGAPRVNLEIGDETRPAVFDGEGRFNNPLPRFGYKPTSGDDDRDGISVRTDALTLPAGARISRGGVSADLTLPGTPPYTVRNDPGHKVVAQAVVTRVEITSEPQLKANVYAASNVEAEQEEIVVELIFSTEVTVVGAPGLNLEIGDTTRLATYDAELNPTGTTDTVVFGYTPVAGDEDGNGISIRSDALVLPEGVRIHVSEIDVNPTLPITRREDGVAYVIRDDRSHRVAISDGVLIRIRVFLEGALE